jgi:hypothetical protein
MLKRILLAALLLPLLAFGQSYPSPTFNNVTINGTLTVSGGLPPSGLAPQAANTVLGNATGSSAVPTALAVPSCSTANSGLKWTSASGFSCGTVFALTSGNLSQFASTTSAQLASIISDETGSGGLVFANSPTFTGSPVIPGYALLSSPALTGTPTAPTATAGTNTTQIATTAFVLANSGGCTSCTITTPNIVGVTNGSNASTGSVGEYNSVTGTATSLTTTTYTNLTSQSLAAGDYDVQCEVSYSIGAGATALSVAAVASTTSASTAALGNSYLIGGINLTTSIGSSIVASPPVRVNISTATTTYCVGWSVFSGGTVTGTGFLRWRRVR